MKSKSPRYPKLSDHTKIWYGILKQGIQDMFDAGKISQAQYNETIDMLDALLAEQGGGE